MELIVKTAVTRAYNELIVQLLEVADKKQNQTQNTICIGCTLDRTIFLSRRIFKGKGFSGTDVTLD